MPSCAVKKCKNYDLKCTKKRGGISYHRFPKTPKMKRKWVEALGREDSWIPTTCTRVCSAHFEDCYYKISPKGIKRLHKDAVPTRNLYKEVNLQKCVSSNSVEQALVDSPHKLQLDIKRLRYLLDKQKELNKRLNTTVRRAKVKIFNLKKVIEELKKKSDNTDYSLKTLLVPKTEPLWIEVPII